ncbi:putative Ufm1-specific protease, partial [Trichinella sp. T8]
LLRSILPNNSYNLMQLKVYESYFKETSRYIEHHGELATHGILLGSSFNDAVIIYRALLFKNEVDVYSELRSIWNSLVGVTRTGSIEMNINLEPVIPQWITAREIQSQLITLKSSLKLQAQIALDLHSSKGNYKVYSIPVNLEPVICLRSEVGVNAIHINFEIAIIRLLEQAKQCLLKNCNFEDGFDDRGWGCAYRSLQTIWSWFILNGYTEKPVPNHRQIQQALADIGDKPKSFVGTKQWIGSMELSYCIDHLLGITCRTLSLSSREELTDWAEELRRHFHSAGTPVMIGGGNLAHTILGVSIDEETGEAKYLVLDPHYAGAEDLKSITQKGWCGWKTVDFWSSDSFHNLLLPLLPDQH